MVGRSRRLRGRLISFIGRLGTGVAVRRFVVLPLGPKPDDLC